MAVTKPLLRWAGGKTWLVQYIQSILPGLFRNYYEPFLGGGAVFFNILPQSKSFLSDTNAELINAYTQIRDNVEVLLQILANSENSKDYYYSVRSSTPTDPIVQASRFIYLNRTSFNGIYRVNLQGEYNVPFGYKNYTKLFDFDKILETSRALKGAELLCIDFYKTLDKICANDLVFIDPPYTVAHGGNGFIKYNENIFRWDDQLRLARYVERIKELGAYYILTNAMHESVYNLFSVLDRPNVLKRNSVVGGKKARRGSVEEYLFTNL